MQALRDLLKPERMTAIVDVVGSEVEGNPPYQRMLDEGVCTAITITPKDVRPAQDPDLLKITGPCEMTGMLGTWPDKVAAQVHVSFFPEYTFGKIDRELRRLGFILHCFADSYVAPILSGTSIPHPDPHQIAQSDLFYVRDFTKPMLVEQWKHLALIAHHVCGSFDLAMYAVHRLAALGAIPSDAPASYRRILEIG